MLRMNWIHGSTMWRNGSYHAMRNATGMDVTKAIPKPVRTRESDAQVCSQSVPETARVTAASQTSIGDAKTAGQALLAKNQSAPAQATDISTHTQLGIFAQMGTFFSFCIATSSFLREDRCRSRSIWLLKRISSRTNILIKHSSRLLAELIGGSLAFNRRITVFQGH